MGMMYISYFVLLFQFLIIQGVQNQLFASEYIKNFDWTLCIYGAHRFEFLVVLKFRVIFSAGSRNQQISCVSYVSKLNFKLLKHFYSYVFLVKMKVFALVKSSCMNLLESALDFYMSHFGTCDVLPFRIFVHIIVLLEKWQPSSTFFLVLEVSIIATF